MMNNIAKHLFYIAVLFTCGIAQANPTPISTCAGLKNIEANMNGHYILIDNIDCKGIYFTPIHHSYPFRGKLEGAGYTIANLTISTSVFQSSAEFTGLFALLENAVITDIHFTNAQLNNVEYPSYTDKYAGLIAGRTRGHTSITNITVAGLQIGMNHYPDNVYYTGGIVGQTKDSSLLSNVHVYDALIANGDGAAGGLIGQTLGVSTIVSSSVNGLKTHKKEGYACGDHRYLCAFGGLIGDIAPGVVQITQSSSSGDIDTYRGVGGLIGRSNGTVGITDSYARTDVTSYHHGGGLIGEILEGYITLKNVYAAGKVTRVSDESTTHRGIVGYGSPGKPDANNGTPYISGSESYFDTKATGRDNSGDNISKPLTTREMTAGPDGKYFRFDNWDPAIWIFEKDAYPHLKK